MVNGVTFSNDPDKVYSKTDIYLIYLYFSLWKLAKSVSPHQTTAHIFTRGCVYNMNRSRPLPAFITRRIYGSSDWFQVQQFANLLELDSVEIYFF